MLTLPPRIAGPPKFEQSHHDPGIEDKSKYSVLEQDLKIGVVDDRHVWAEAQNLIFHLQARATCAPSIQWVLHEHLPARLIGCESKFRRAAIHESVMDPVTNLSHSSDQRDHGEHAASDHSDGKAADTRTRRSESKE